MASLADPSSTVPQTSPQPAGSPSQPEETQEALSSSPVEMRTLPASTTTPTTTKSAPHAADTPATAPTDVSTPPTAESDPSKSTEAAQMAPATRSRADTEAIGPSTDTPAANPDNTNGPVLAIMLLLTTGARHPYKIDEKYLKKRNVTVEDMDPYNISVYTLKELIWRDWREEWETRPTSPTSIRLIHFGRMLDDKSPLKDCRFQTDTPNVVHMTVKPQEVVDEEENAKSGKGANRRDGEEEQTTGCHCVIL